MKAKRSRRRTLLRCLSFGLLSLSLVTLILGGSAHSPDHAVKTLLPADAMGGVTPRLLLFGIAALSLVCCIGAELALRRDSHR
jgi:hypothetical protein